MTESVKEQAQVVEAEQPVKHLDSEQVFDMLPYVADIYDKTDFDKYRKSLQEKYKKRKKLNPVDPAIDAVKFLIKNSPKIKDDFFAIVAIAERKEIEEVKKQSFFKTIKTVKMIFSNPEVSDFLKEAM